MKKQITISALIKQFPKVINGFTFIIDSLSGSYPEPTKVVIKARLDLKPDYRIDYIDGSHEEMTEKMFHSKKPFPYLIRDIKEISRSVSLTCKTPINNVSDVIEKMQNIISFFNPLKETFTPKGFKLLKDKKFLIGYEWCLEHGRNEDIK